MKTILDAQVTIEDPIFVITIEDHISHSTPRVKENEPQMAKDPMVKAISSLSTTARKGEDLASPPILLHHNVNPMIHHHFVEMLALLSVVF